MSLDSLSWGSPDWVLPAVGFIVVALVALLFGYRRVPLRPGMRACAALLKAAGIVILALCLMEPLVQETRPRPGANLFVVAVDQSASLGVQENEAPASRGVQLQSSLVDDAPWVKTLSDVFEVRRYTFDRQLRSVESFGELSFDGEGSALGASLDSIAKRFQGRPLAGVLLITDGLATDRVELSRGSEWPPLYPVVVGGSDLRDISVEQVSVSQSSFETAPVSISAEVSHRGYEDEEIVAEVYDESGERLQRVVERADATGRLTARFQLQPKSPGVHFYEVRAGAADEMPAASEASDEADSVEDDDVEDDVAGGDEPEDDWEDASGDDDGGDDVAVASEEFDGAEDDGDEPSGEFVGVIPEESREATQRNNRRVVAVNRSRGPYRILYVSGRPNWEFKFLRRALAEDDEVELLGLIRIAKREPKFEYRSRFGETTNPLFRGFDNEDEEVVERYDEPVLLRLGTEDENELRDGFPKVADVLFAYDAVILDDVEAEFFNTDQKDLLREFVSRRGGGFLMLGGQESFAKGKYTRTPIGELLPVYVDPNTAFTPSPDGYRLELTRDGQMQPWVRLRKTEIEEAARLREMPDFSTLNPVRGIKPGATVLMRARNSSGDTFPALVAQRFGKGRAAALMIGDLWRWSLRREDPAENDQAVAWRQIARWLTADVPRPVELDVQEGSEGGRAVELVVTVQDENYEPLDNSAVVVTVEGPEGESLDLTATGSRDVAGRYTVRYTPRLPGPYRVSVSVRGPDGRELPSAEAGWTFEPAAREFAELVPNRELLGRLAADTGGEVIELAALEEFVGTLPERNVPVTDPAVDPLWHRWSVLLLGALCLCAEWALRRWKGLP